jgi:cullin 1
MKPVNLSDIWGDLSQGIQHIYSRQNMPKKRYMELYTHVYNHCTSIQHPTSAPAIRPKGKRAPANSASGGGAQFVGIELYTKLKEFLYGHLMAIRPVSVQYADYRSKRPTRT